jgi:hypothetical protein
MTLAQPETEFVHAPFLKAYAARISDEMPDPKWSDPIGWSRGIRQATDLLDPNYITISGREVVQADVENAGVGCIEDAALSETLGEATDQFVEAAGIVDEVRDEPLVAVVPSSVTVSVEHFGEEWFDLIDSDEFAALDVLHEVSQMLTALIRGLGTTVDGIVVDCNGFGLVQNRGLRYDDVLLEMGPVTNVANHHEMSVLGLFPQTLFDSVQSDPFRDEFEALIFDTIPQDLLGSISAGSVGIGGGFPKTVWDQTETDFEQELIEYIDALPRGFLLTPTIPETASPERVQFYRELLNR